MIIILIFSVFTLNLKVDDNKHYYSRVVGYQLTCYFLERPNIREQHSSKQVLYFIRLEAVGVSLTLIRNFGHLLTLYLSTLNRSA